MIIVINQETIWCRGVAARALALQQNMEKHTGRVTYVVILEGWCRFGVQDLSSNGSYKSARVTQLDLNQSGKLLPDVSAFAESQGNLALIICLYLGCTNRACLC